jgi:ubiquinone/menaquinone biosynthesis C-methylase UbiE
LIISDKIGATPVYHDIIEGLSTDYCRIDRESYGLVIKALENFPFEVYDFNPERVANEALSPKKSVDQADILIKFTELRGKKVLEIGSGWGINFIVWTRKYNIDGYGLEPDGLGFESSYKISKRLVKCNAIDENRIINASGENIPFSDNTFDVVFSTNVLEHVENPVKVLSEALRVLKPGGILQIIYPNYHSYYDGHYNIFHPPIPSNKFFQWYVRTIFNKDASFAKTLRTELNMKWTRKNIKQLSNTYNIEILSFGKEVFLERMKNLNFVTTGSLIKVKAFLNVMKRMKVNVAMGRIILLLNGWSPIILTLRKT